MTEGDAISIRKVLNASTPAIFDQIQTEVQALRNLDHPAIPKLLSFSSNGKIDLTREYKKGKSLRELLDEGRTFSIDEVVDIALKTADVLLYGHSKGILHRDIKPSNMIYDEQGNVSVVDWGLAKLRYFSGTTTSTLGGSFPYTAPEQYFGRSVPASDIFALGATMVELLTGKTLDKYIEGDSIMEQRVVLPDTIEMNLVNILTRMTETDSRRRYQSCEDTIKVLEAFKEHRMKGGILALPGTSLVRAKQARTVEEGNVEELVDEIIYLMQQNEQGFSQPEEMKKKTSMLLSRIEYTFSHNHKWWNYRYDVRSDLSFYMFTGENEDDTLDVACISSNDPFYVRFVKLKHKSRFNHFCKNLGIYLDLVKMPGFECVDAAQDVWRKQKHHTPEAFSKLYDWSVEYNSLGWIGPLELTGMLIVPIPFIIMHRRNKRRRKMTTLPSFTDEQIEEWKPYFGDVQQGEGAIRAAYESYSSQDTAASVPVADAPIAKQT